VGAVALNYGLFINAMVSFLIVAFVIFLLIRAINHLYQRPAAAATTKVCPFCMFEIPLAAKRIPMLDSVRKKAVVNAGQKGCHRVSPPSGAANGSRNPAKHSGSCP
jgi:uncharacterized paraquat-inducible protein A